MVKHEFQVYAFALDLALQHRKCFGNEAVFAFNYRLKRLMLNQQKESLLQASRLARRIGLGESECKLRSKRFQWNTKGNAMCLILTILFSDLQSDKTTR